jgi:pimeloyl-ACP methyl ester carboxylesterase
MAAMRVDVSALLPSIPVPVLLLVASRDRLLARSATAALAAGLPSCRTVTIAGPHLLLQAAAQRCAEEIAAFVGIGTNVPSAAE